MAENFKEIQANPTSPCDNCGLVRFFGSSGSIFCVSQNKADSIDKQNRRIYSHRSPFNFRQQTQRLKVEEGGTCSSPSQRVKVS